MRTSSASWARRLSCVTGSSAAGALASAAVVARRGDRPERGRFDLRSVRLCFIRSLSFIVVTASGRCPTGGCRSGAICGATRFDELQHRQRDRRPGSDSTSGSPWFSDSGTDRELGIATSTLMPTVRSMAGMVSPVRGVGPVEHEVPEVLRLADDAQRLDLLHRRPDAGHVGGRDEQEVGGVLERGERVLVEPRGGVDHHVLERLGEQLEHPFDLLDR